MLIIHVNARRKNVFFVLSAVVVRSKCITFFKGEANFRTSGGGAVNVPPELDQK